MKTQSASWILAAAKILVTNPINAPLYAYDSLMGRRTKARRIKFGDIELKIRTGSPDLKVVRSCLLGEFDEVYSYISGRHKLIIDVGGYIGLVSILFARKFPDSQIVCLEPSSENFELCSFNTRPYRNIKVLNAALANSSGTATLKDRGTGQWGFTIVESSADNAGAQPLEQVRTVTIEDILRLEGKQGVDLVKLDIEGGEYALLKDCPNWVDHVDVIVAEIHDKICPGASAVFDAAMAGRQEVPLQGEKRMSILADGQIKRDV